MNKTDLNTYHIEKSTVIKNEQENLTSLTIFNLGKTTVTYNEVFEISPAMGAQGVTLIDSKINPVRTKNIKLSFKDNNDVDNKVLISISTIHTNPCN